MEFISFFRLANEVKGVQAKNFSDFRDFTDLNPVNQWLNNLASVQEKVMLLPGAVVIEPTE